MLQIIEQVDLTPLHTFQLPSCSQFYCRVQSDEDLFALADYIKDSKYSNFFVLGEGSNVILPSYHRGLCVQIFNQKIKCIQESKQHVWINVGAGKKFDDLVAYCVENGFYGLEKLSWIPGSVGAAPVQNIGAYGAEIAPFIESVECFDVRDKKRVSIQAKDCGFAYRDSIFKQKKYHHLLIYSVIFRLNKYEDLMLEYYDLKNFFEMHPEMTVSAHTIRQAVIQIRKAKLPDPDMSPNAGSFFKNPVLSKSQFDMIRAQYPNCRGHLQPNGTFKLSAAWLIEKLGLKGCSCEDGTIGVSDQHALVLVHHGGGTTDALLAWASQIQNQIHLHFNIFLEIEPIRIQGASVP